VWRVGVVITDEGVRPGLSFRDKCQPTLGLAGFVSAICGHSRDCGIGEQSTRAPNRRPRPRQPPATTWMLITRSSPTQLEEVLRLRCGPQLRASREPSSPDRRQDPAPASRSVVTLDLLLFGRRGPMPPGSR